MKKIIVGLIIGLVVSIGGLIIFYLFGPFTLKTVCFGDVCPDNGGTYLFFKKNYTKEECLAMKGDPVVGFGWTEVYAGCSPNSKFYIKGR